MRKFKDHLHSHVLLLAVVLLLLSSVVSLMLYYLLFGSKIESDRLVLIFLNISLLVGAVSGLWYLIFRRIAFEVKQDTDAILGYLEDVSHKNYGATIRSEHFLEFLQISLKMKNLVKKLQKRDKQRRKAVAKFRVSSRQKSDILSAISHEIKNPITAILGYSEALMEDGLDHEKQKRFLKKIVNNSAKITAIIDKLTLLSSLEEGRSEPKLEKFNLYELSYQIALDAQISRKQSRVELDIPADVMIKSDKILMQIVITNLVENALKYSDKMVLVQFKDSHLSVTDQGIGIESSKLKKITKKYYRVKANSWDNSMGLGLFIVTTILKELGSRLDISSHPNEGSSFSFEIK